MTLLCRLFGHRFIDLTDAPFELKWHDKWSVTEYTVGQCERCCRVECVERTGVY